MTNKAIMKQGFLISGWWKFLFTPIKTFILFWLVYKKFIHVLFSEWGCKLQIKSFFYLSRFSIVPDSTSYLLYVQEICMAYFLNNFRSIGIMQTWNREHPCKFYYYHSANILYNCCPFVKSKKLNKWQNLVRSNHCLH